MTQWRAERNRFEKVLAETKARERSREDSRGGAGRFGREKSKNREKSPYLLIHLMQNSERGEGRASVGAALLFTNTHQVVMAGKDRLGNPDGGKRNAQQASGGKEGGGKLKGSEPEG